VIDDDSDDARHTTANFDLNTIVAQVVPVFVTGLMNGSIKVPGLGALLDWRKAAPVKQLDSAEPEVVKSAKPIRAVKATPAPAADATLPPMDSAALAHFAAVQSALTSEERDLAREVAANLTAAELRTWFDELSALSVPDAADKIRKIIGGLKPGAVS
jgi:hypothetical protein